MSDYLDPDHWVNGGDMHSTSEETIATEIILLEAEREIDRLKAELAEVKAVLELERRFHLKIAFRADKLHLQLQAIRESAFGELVSITAGEPENMGGIQEIE
jgi:hypothetical protein